MIQSQQKQLAHTEFVHSFFYDTPEWVRSIVFALCDTPVLDRKLAGVL